VAGLNIPDVVRAVRQVVGPDPVQLHQPEFSGNEHKYVNECIDSTFVSSVGAFVDRFESMLADLTGARHAVACVNGTAALQMCFVLAGVSRDDEIIMPPLTFVAAANSLSYLGAIPHFVDNERGTLGLSANALSERLDAVGTKRDSKIFNRETGRQIAAIAPMHTFGHPVDLDGILDVAKSWGLPVIEDAAESIGSFYRGRHTGTFGLLGALSFNGNKTITTGGGGAILTNDDALARRAKHLTTTAKQPHRWAFDHDELGYNFRLPNINAALGCAQLEQLGSFVDDKRALASRYLAACGSLAGATIFKEPEHAKSNYWLNTMLLDADQGDGRDGLLAALNDAGIMARPSWTLMHRLPMYRTSPRGELSVAEELQRRIVNLPSSAALGR
jgi:perosamine synthetase